MSAPGVKPSFPESCERILLLAWVDTDRSGHLGLESVDRLDREERLCADDDGRDEDDKRDEDGYFGSGDYGWFSSGRK